MARASELDRPVGRGEEVFTVSPVAFRFRKVTERFVGGVVVLVSALGSELIFVWVLSDTAMSSEPWGDCTILLLSVARSH